MSIITAGTATIPGLLSLFADSVESDQTGTTMTGPAVTIETPGLPSALGALVGAWMAVKDYGQGWMLLQFAASTDEIPEAGVRTPETEAPAVEPRPLPTRPDFAARARRVHTALTEREPEVLCLVAGG